MTSPLSFDDRLRERSRAYHVQGLAQAFPDQTVIHTISKDAWGDEEERIRRALLAGGYARANQIELHMPALEALLDELHEIAVENGSDYDVAYAENRSGDFEVTMVFATVKDAMLFKMALP